MLNVARSGAPDLSTLIGETVGLGHAQRSLDGPGFRYVRTEQANIAPSSAEKILALNLFEGQRAIRPARVEMLKQKIESGFFRKAMIAIAVFGEKHVLVDGQHTLHAVVELDCAVPATVDFYEADTDLGLSRLFTQFNNEGGRTQREHMAAFRSGSDHYREWSPILMTKIASGLLFLEVVTSGAKSGQSPGGRLRTNDERALILEGHEGEAEFVREILGSNYQRRADGGGWIARAPIVAAMIRTFRASPDAASTFWTQVRDGEMMKAGDPRHMLRERLMRERLGGSSRERVKGYGLCISAWNAYRTGEKKEYLKPSALNRKVEV